MLLAALGLGAYFLLWVVGFLYGMLSYIFWIGLIAIGGTIGYKLFLSGDSKDDVPQLEEKKPIGISEFDEADRALEEMKRKYLPTEKK